MADHTAINTLEFVEDLEQAGVGPGKARAISKALDKALMAHLATREDLTETRAELTTGFAETKSEFKGDIAELRGELAETKSELKGDIAELRGELVETKAELKGDIAELRGELAETKSELKGDLAALGKRVDALESRIDTLVEKLAWRVLAGTAALLAVLGAFLKFV